MTAPAPPGASSPLDAPGALAPRPGAAAPGRLVLAQAGLELRLLLRNGEQLLLTAVIPVLLLVLFATVDVGAVPGSDARSRLDGLAPGVLALAVLSTAFTGLAIATGFERRYGVLKRLGATPLPRAGLLAAKSLVVLTVEAGQLAVLAGIAAALGWRPAGTVPGDLAGVVTLTLLGTIAFASFGLLMAGTLKAEVTLAGANLVYLLLLAGGGIVVPLTRFPHGVATVLGLSPAAALSHGLRAVLTAGHAVPGSDLAILAVWAVLGTVAAARWFRWE